MYEMLYEGLIWSYRVFILAITVACLYVIKHHKGTSPSRRAFSVLLHPSYLMAFDDVTSVTCMHNTKFNDFLGILIHRVRAIALPVAAYINMVNMSYLLSKTSLTFFPCTVNDGK